MLSPYHGPWSPVMKANSYVRSTIFKYLHLGGKLELSSVLKIKTITLPVPILFAEWVLAFQHCKLIFQQNYAQQKRRQKNAQYNNIYVEMSHTVSKSYWFDSIYDYTCLFDHFCGWPAPLKVFWVQTSSSYGAK